MSKYSAQIRAVSLPVLLHSIIVVVATLVSMQMPELAPAGFVNPLLSPTIPFVEKFIKWDAHWYTYAAHAGSPDSSRAGSSQHNNFSFGPAAFTSPWSRRFWSVGKGVHTNGRPGHNDDNRDIG
jgi:hypothetical protein